MEKLVYPAIVGNAPFADQAVPLGPGEDDYDSVVRPASPVRAPTTRTAAFDERAGLLMEHVPEQKWYSRLNPLNWREIPPVPEERRVSREYTASICSVLTFQWISPLMRVS